MKLILRHCGLLLLIGINSCSESEKMPLTEHYYTEPTEDGDSRLYFDDPRLGPTELGVPSSVGIAKGYVASLEGGEGNCYLFPAEAATVEAARSGQIGPLTKDACEQKVLQLTGDSLRIFRLID